MNNVLKILLILFCIKCSYVNEKSKKPLINFAKRKLLRTKEPIHTESNCGGSSQEEPIYSILNQCEPSHGELNHPQSALINNEQMNSVIFELKNKSLKNKEDLLNTRESNIDDNTDITYDNGSNGNEVTSIDNLSVDEGRLSGKQSVDQNNGSFIPITFTTDTSRPSTSGTSTLNISTRDKPTPSTSIIDTSSPSTSTKNKSINTSTDTVITIQPRSSQLDLITSDPESISLLNDLPSTSANLLQRKSILDDVNTHHTSCFNKKNSICSNLLDMCASCTVSFNLI